jgi:adenine-specific DNA-methyltransferase
MKLELNWINKHLEYKLEPRILISDPELCYGNDYNNGNMLIQGDNLLALKALEADWNSRIKCIFADPPYNTGQAFTHYDDNIEHSLWLSLMRPRIILLHRLLSNDGVLWISISDNEAHYLKVLIDEIFGRTNFISNVVWEKKYSPQNDAKWLSDNHDHILVYAKNKNLWRPNLLPRTDEMNKKYKNLDNDPRGNWKSTDLSVKTYSKSGDYTIKTPSGKIVYPPNGRVWSVSENTLKNLIADNRIYFGKNGSNVPSKKTFLTEVQDGLVPRTIWTRDDVGDNQEAKNEVKIFNHKEIFDTPKPERLLKRIIELSSHKGDYVLDSFLGSGTTAAVAQKMGRKWIGIELGDHAKTHCLPRLKAVVDGEQGGISKSIDWKGGGGFKFYTLAPSLLNEDKYGNWIISKEYNALMLASAVAKQEGFKYEPDEHVYWKQGMSSEKDFIFTTTQFITAELMDKIHEEMLPGESLLIACKSYQAGCENRHANISIKKIPHMLMGRCEYGKDDYSFNIVNMPVDEDAEPWEEPEVANEVTSKKTNKP